MQQKSQQLLRDSTIEPTAQVLEKALGNANEAYVNFVRELVSQDITIEWRYYTDGKAWLAKGVHRWIGTRGGQKEITVFWLSIWEGFFKLSIYFPVKCREEILQLPLPLEVIQMIKDSKQMGSKLKFFPIVFDLYSENLFESIFCMFDFKKKIK